MYCQILIVANLFMTIACRESGTYPECFDEIKYEKSYDVEWIEESETVCETKYKYIDFYLWSLTIGHIDGMRQFLQKWLQDHFWTSVFTKARKGMWNKVCWKMPILVKDQVLHSL